MDRVDKVVGLITDVIGADLVGAYLHGSSVLGRLRPAGDVDILAVTTRSLDQRQRRALVAGMLPISGATAGARPVELTVVVQTQARPWRYPPICDFLYAEWLRADYRSGLVPAAAPMPNLVVEIAVPLIGDHPLAGPRPTASGPDRLPTGRFWPLRTVRSRFHAKVTASSTTGGSWLLRGDLAAGAFNWGHGDRHVHLG
jgi:predicted nucleotidyltransferase